MDTKYLKEQCVSQHRRGGGVPTDKKQIPHQRGNLSPPSIRKNKISKNQLPTKVYCYKCCKIFFKLNIYDVLQCFCNVCQRPSGKLLTQMSVGQQTWRLGIGGLAQMLPHYDEKNISI